MIKKLLLKTYYLTTVRRIIVPWFFKNPFKKTDLVIYDTIFPNPISGFRYAEFTEYLSYYKNSKIVVFPTGYKYLNQTPTHLREDIEEFNKNKPDLSSKLHIIKNVANINCKLFYCVFYGVIVGKIKILNNLKIPFVFTLYPGGAFNLIDKTVKENLLKVCSSPFFCGVIVTQKVTKDFLIENGICDMNKIHYIFGGIVPQNSIDVEKKAFYDYNKLTLDICFCAGKYMEKGRDKGYDLFVETAHLIAKKYESARFHVIGGFDRDEIDLESVSDKFIFYGYRKYEELKEIFSEMDFIFSPNRPNILQDGLFDGFPLGTVVEAALNGVIPLLTDELNQNDAFNEGEVFICKPFKESFFEKFEEILEQDRRKISLEVQQKFRLIYCNENQLSKRIKILNDQLEKIS